MAQPEIAELARQMWELYKSSKPQRLLNYHWHLPFVSLEEQATHFRNMGPGVVTSTNIEHWLPLIKKSVARCARVSYLNHMNERPTEDEDYKLYDRLVGAQPIHASPAEHQAAPFLDEEGLCNGSGCSGNFKGWTQYRKLIPNENITEFTGPLP